MADELAVFINKVDEQVGVKFNPGNVLVLGLLDGGGAKFGWS